MLIPEWIELYNNRGQEIDVSGWKIENAGAENKTLEISTGKISPESFFLICKKEMENCNLITWALSLNNDYKENGKMALKDNLNNIIDQTPQAENKEWPAGSNQTKQTMERKNSLALGNNSDNWATSIAPGGTPKAKNSVAIESMLPAPEETAAEPELKPEPEPKPESHDEQLTMLPTDKKPVVYPSGVVINEILPSPTGPDAEEEWIEIFNQNNFAINLSGWQIIDNGGKAQTYTFPEGTTVDPQGFLVLSCPTTKITLNNDGDGLNLIQPNGKIIDSVAYEKTPPGQSFNRTDS